MFYRGGGGSGTSVHHSDQRELLQVSSNDGRISGSRIKHDRVSVLFQILLSTTMVIEDLLIEITSVHCRFQFSYWEYMSVGLSAKFRHKKNCTFSRYSTS